MKKHRLKSYFKIGILLFGISFLLTNCEKELTDDVVIQHNSRFTVKILNKNQVLSNKQVAKKLQKILPKSISNDNNSLSREIHNSDYGFTINTDYVKLIDDGIKHSYNFPIIRDTIVNQNVENLLLYSNEQGNYDAYIVTYSFTKEQYYNLNPTDDYSTTFTPIDFDTSVFNDEELTKVLAPQLVCSETQIYVNNAQCECGCDCPAQWEWVTVAFDCNWIGGNSGPESGDDTNNPGNDNSNTGAENDGNPSGDDNVGNNLGTSCRGCDDSYPIITAPAIDPADPDCEKLKNQLTSQ
ncbi:hypothetical protein [Lacinutrix himadriensis]|uniref:hypothetical protein n=1 Tax=Lacinutrix himadriensis TaxID=641549 RepID=UPI0006E3643A|nr:hypothetical protein [Lacinutrix himadriensis]